MSDSHPYISGAGNVAKMVTHPRASFPSSVTSETVKRLGIAPNNESFVINVLQFIGVLDGDGKKTDAASKVFSQHQDDEFASGFARQGNGVRDNSSGTGAPGRAARIGSSAHVLAYFPNDKVESYKLGNGIIRLAERDARQLVKNLGWARGECPRRKPRLQLKKQGSECTFFNAKW